MSEYEIGQMGTNAKKGCTCLGSKSN